ncbi:MAG TPA: DUF4145 domain-containing protein [Gaiellaceae bacterium]|nr:DUF4145 domain-containing protein [Gaiellaceae bacterium]
MTLKSHHAVFDQPLVIPSPGGFMKCPTCGEHTPDAWEGFNPAAFMTKAEHNLSLDHMRCANNDCKEMVIRATESWTTVGGFPRWHSETWVVFPRWADTKRPVDALVSDEFRRDYEEAAAILELSPRMSAVLSRKVLYDLLARYAEIAEYTLKGSIDKFSADERHPQRIRENLHHLREIGDFSAHTQRDKSDQGQIIEVGKIEAEWTLDLVERLFDYFIVGPEHDRQLREAMDAKIEAAGRNPISPEESS